MKNPTLPPSYFFSAIVLMALLHYLLPVREIITWPWTVLGIAFLVAGAMLNLSADKAFKVNNTTVKPFQESARLITAGVFGVTRNPMYLGMALILAGIATMAGTVTPFLVIPVFVVLMDWVFIRAEEGMLAQRFGDQWLDYKQRVRKWI